jgi:hypothetical protein
MSESESESDPDPDPEWGSAGSPSPERRRGPSLAPHSSAGSAADGDRGQAFTLEGVLGAFVVLAAVLFAVQAIVGGSGAGGTVDADARETLRTEATGILATTADQPVADLAYVVRYWSSGEQRFYGSRSRTVGYGEAGPPTAMFGQSFDRTFTAQGRSFNIVIRYREDPTDLSSGSERMVWRGPPGTDAVVASQTVALYDNMTLTAPDASSRELWEYDTNATDDDDGFYPIPDAAPNSPLYNVVEIRVIVW